MKSALEPYFGKRDFRITSEPQGGKSSTGGGCCQAPGGDLSFLLGALPVGFALLRRRRR